MLRGGVYVFCVAAFVVQQAAPTTAAQTQAERVALGLDDANAPTFSITDSLYLVYQNVAERDHVIATVLQLWKNALVPFQAFHTDIKFVSGSAVSQGAANQMNVIFKLSGQSRLPIDVQAAKTSFHATIDAAHLVIVENNPDWASVGDVGSADKSAGGDDNSGDAAGDDSDKGDGQSFEITSLEITMTYTSSKERDSFLQQILAIWKKSLSVYNVISIEIHFVSEKLVASKSSSSKKVYTVTYTISGTSKTSVDQNEAKKSFQTALVNAHFTFVIIVSGADSDSSDSTDDSSSAQTTGSGDDSDDDQSGGKTTDKSGAKIAGGSDDSDSGSDVSSDSSLPFEITDSISISYKNPNERDTLLQQNLLSFWKKALGSYQVVNIKIVFISEKVDTSAKGSNDKVYIVKYRIDGQSAKPVDEGQARKDFQKSVDDAHLPQVTPSTDTDSGSGYLITDNVAIVLNYKSSKERDSILNRLFALCRKVLDDLYQATDLEIIFDGSKPSGSGTTFNYHMSYTTQVPIDVDKVKAAIQKELASQHISGVVSLIIHSSGEQSDDDSGSDDSGSPSTTLVSDSLVLTYTDKAQRESILNRLLTVWRTAFKLYKVTNLQIIVDGEEETPSEDGSGKSYIVKYHISGQSDKPVDQDKVKTSFKTLITTSHISGVVSVTVTISGTATSWSSGDSSGSWSVGGSASASSSSSGGSSKVVTPAPESGTDNSEGDSVSTSDSSGDSTGGDSDSGSSSETSLPFEISDSISFAYKNTQERDSFLQKLLAFWKKALATYKSVDITITFTSEKIDSSAKPSSYGKVYIVTYRINGESSTIVDQDEARATFESSLGDANLPQLSVSTTGDDSGFMYFMTDNVDIVLSYSSSKVRDSLLNKVFAMCRKVIDDVYQATDLQIMYDGTKPGKSAGSAKTSTFSYHLTFKTLVVVELDKLKEAIQKALATAPINGLVSITIHSSGDEDTDEDSGPTTGPTISKLVSDSVVLSYTNKAQRDSIMSQILSVWRKTFSGLGYKVTNLQIIFDGEEPTTSPSYTGKANIVKYHVNGISDKPIDQNKATATFKKSLTDAGISGVISVTITVSGSWTYTGGNKIKPAAKTTTTTQAPDSGSDDADDSALLFEIGDSISFAYNNQKERDSFLQKLLAFWKTALAPYQSQNVDITFVSEKVDTSSKPSSYGKVYVVTYRINGKSPLIVDQDEARAAFQKALDDARLPQLSVTVVDDSVSVYFMTDNVDIVLTYSSSKARDTLLNNVFQMLRKVIGDIYQSTNLQIIYDGTKDTKSTGSGKTSTFSYHLTFTTQKTVDVDVVKDAIQKALGVAPINGLIMITIHSSGDEDTDEDSGPTTGPTISKLVSDSVVLSYTNKAQRDSIMSQILSVWRKTFSGLGYKVTNLQIIFDGEEPTTSPSYTGKANIVKYHVNGISDKPIDQNKVTATFKKSLTGAGISGVISVTITVSGTWTYIGGKQKVKPTVTTTQAPDENEFTGFQFSFEHAVSIKYNGDFEMNDDLKKLEDLWMSILMKFNVDSAVNIRVKSNVLSNGAHKITYIISGASAKYIDTAQLIAAFQKALADAHWTFVVSSEVKEASPEDAGDIGGSVVLTYADKQQRDDLLNQILLIWKNTLISMGYRVTNMRIFLTSERLITSSLRFSNYRSYVVTYQVTGITDKPINVALVQAAIIKALANSHIFGLSSSSVTITGSVAVSGSWFIGGSVSGSVSGGSGSARTDDSDDSTGGGSSGNEITGDITPDSGPDNSGDDDSDSGSSSDTSFPFEITDSISFAYKNQQERDNFLQKLLAFWKTALSAYQVVNVKIFFISEKTDTSAKSNNYGKVYIVKYRIDGQSPKPVDNGQARIIFQKTVDDAHLPQVTPSTDTDSGSGYLITDNVAIVLNYKSSKERDSILNRLFTLCRKVLDDLYQVTDLEIIFDGTKPATSTGSGTTSTFSYHLSYTTQVPVDVAKVKAAIQKELASQHISGVVSLTIHTSGEQSDDDSGSDDTGSSTTLVSDSLVLTYTSKAQRDSILNRILTVWRTAFSGLYTVTDLQIIFDEEVPTTSTGSGKYYIVKYHITGKSDKPVDQDKVQTAFKKYIVTAHISGVVSVTVTISGTTSSFSFGGSSSGGSSSSGGGSWSVSGSGSWSSGGGSSKMVTSAPDSGTDNSGGDDSGTDDSGSFNSSTNATYAGSGGQSCSCTCVA